MKDKAKSNLFNRNPFLRGYAEILKIFVIQVTHISDNKLRDAEYFTGSAETWSTQKCW